MATFDIRGPGGQRTAVFQPRVFGRSNGAAQRQAEQDATDAFERGDLTRNEIDAMNDYYWPKEGSHGDR